MTVFQNGGSRDCIFVRAGNEAISVFGFSICLLGRCWNWIVHEGTGFKLDLKEAGEEEGLKSHRFGLVLGQHLTE